MVEAFDWTSTSLGPPAQWSAGLRAAVGICLTSSFPMLVVWGPDLVKIYNDGYRPMLGSEKHPRALGAPAIEIWPEIWDTIGPMFDQVMTTGRSTWIEHQLLVLERNGFPEECYFTYSYSPLFDDDGSVGGVLDVVTETTDQIVAQRRLACLTAVGSALLGAEQVTDVCVRAAAALASARDDVRGVDLYLRVGEQLGLVASSRRDDVSPIDAATLLEVADHRRSVVMGHAGDGRPAAHLALPIGGVRGGVDGVLVASLNPQRPFDDGYESFLMLLAGSITAALDVAYRHGVEVGQYRQISDTLQAAMLTPASDLPTVAARYLPAVGSLAVGGDWYDVIDLGESRRAMVVGDCVGHGLAAATVMAQLRSAARAMLLEGRDPAETLSALDGFATSIEGAFCTTVVVVIIDRSADVVTYSRAGHPPPLVVGARGLVWLDDASGMPLAVDPTLVRTNATRQLHHDDVLVMYSDGLVERRDEHLDVGLQRLATAATELWGHNVQQFADGLLRRLLPENTRDDVVLVVKLLPAEPG